MSLKILLNYQQSWHKEKVDNTSSSCPEVFFLKSHFGMGVILQICCIFSEHVFLKTPLVGCFCNTMKNAWQYLNGKMTKILELASLESLRKKYPYSELFWSVFFRIFYLFIYFIFFSERRKVLLTSCISFWDFSRAYCGNLVSIFKVKRTKVHYPSVQNSLIKIGKIKTRFFQINIYGSRRCNLFLQSYNCPTWLSYFQGVGQTQRLVMPRNYRRIIYDTLVIRLNWKSNTMQDQLNLIPTLES